MFKYNKLISIYTSVMLLISSYTTLGSVDLNSELNPDSEDVVEVTEMAEVDANEADAPEESVSSDSESVSSDLESEELEPDFTVSQFSSANQQNIVPEEEIINQENLNQDEPDNTEADFTDASQEDVLIEEEYPAAIQETIIDNIKITVAAEEGTFPKDWTLSVERASEKVNEQAQLAIDSIREENQNVAKAYTFDIKVLDKDGNEIQPMEGKKVKVSFLMPENKDQNVEAKIYHLEGSTEAVHTENNKPSTAEEIIGAEQLEIVSKETASAISNAASHLEGAEETVTVETKGFSYYTVEFTYGNMQYVMEGTSETVATVEMDEILKAVGLTGEITMAETDENAPFGIYQEEGQWFVEATKPFTTTHTLKVTVKEIVFDIELGYRELERTVDLIVTDDIPTTRTITVTKIWENDDATVRPNDIEVHIRKSASTLINGSDLTMKMKALSGQPVSTPRTDNTNITAIKKATEAQYEAVRSTLTTTNEVQASGDKTYMWFTGSTIYYYSEADNIYLNENSNSMCSRMRNLVDISGLAEVNTSYVTSMAFMFEDCVSLVDLSPLTNWDVGNVISMRFMLGANVTNDAQDHMVYTDLTPLSGWNVQKVTDMGSMFKAAQGITTIAPLAGWNVSNLANVNQMFFRAYGITDGTVIKNWNVVRVGQTYYSYGSNANATGNFTQMFGKAGDPTGTNCLTKLTSFTYRPGKWGATNGTYTASTGAASGSAATSTKVQDSSNEYIVGSTGATWTKSGDTWTASINVSNDGSTWQAWEETSGGYIDGKNGVANAYIESSGGVNGYGGSSANPIKGVTSGVTITNKNIVKKELVVTIDWNDSNDLYKDRPVFNNTTGPGGVNLILEYGGQTKTSNSDVTKWVDNGNNKWTYTFTVYTDADISTFELSAHAVPNYTLSENHSITISPSPEGVTQSGITTLTFRHSTEILNRHGLIIANTVSGNQGSRDKYFKVDIQITNGGIATRLNVDLFDADASIPANPNSATTVINTSVNQPTTITTDLLGRANATFYLKSGQDIEISNIIEGTRYTVTIESEDYKTTSVISGIDTDQTKPSENIVQDTSTGISATTEIVFINTRHGVIPSGIEVNSNEGYVISVLAIIGLLSILLKKKLGGANHEQ